MTQVWSYLFFGLVRMNTTKHSIFHFRCRFRINVPWETVMFFEQGLFMWFFFIIIIFYFFKLLSWCSYRWRFVVKDKDGGYHGSRWQFAVTCPRHHDHHLVWGEIEFEQKKKKTFSFLENLLLGIKMQRRNCISMGEKFVNLYINLGNSLLFVWVVLTL